MLLNRFKGSRIRVSLIPDSRSRVIRRAILKQRPSEHRAIRPPLLLQERLLPELPVRRSPFL